MPKSSSIKTIGRAAAALMTAATVACSAPQAAQESPKVATSAELTSSAVQLAPAPETMSTPLPAAPVPGEALVAGFDELAAGLPGQVGVTITGAGQTLTFGTWPGGSAWSTIKVPLSIAAMRADPDTARPLMQSAITQSDNDAAESMWQLLGAGTTAASAVHTVLAEGGNPGVVVQSEQVYPPYSPFGQTQWSQSDAAQFAYALPCIADSGEVLEQMANVAQQWGLAGYTGVQSKGGWGPEASDGGYLVRQIAVVTNESGVHFGVSLAAKPSDGGFATGTSMLSSLGAWVNEHRLEFPTGAC